MARLFKPTSQPHEAIVSHITIVGGTGYVGSAVAHQAIARGHTVISVSRAMPAAHIHGVEYRHGSLLDEDVQRAAALSADVLIAALAPRGDMAANIGPIYASLGRLAAAHGARLGIVGGFAALRRTPGGSRIARTEEADPAFAAAGLAMASVADDLDSAPLDLDWFFVAPPRAFGRRITVDRCPTRTVDGDLATDASAAPLSDTDFASGILDEIEWPRHHRAIFSVVADPDRTPLRG